MSASQDKNQKITFVYSNLYQLYKKEKNSTESFVALQNTGAAIQKGTVLKADNLNQAHVETFSPAQFIAKRVIKKPEFLADLVKPSPAIENLKKNLKTLNELQARLKFMLTEIDELSK